MINNKYRLSLSNHNESELRKAEAVKALAYLIKKYGSETIKKKNSSKSS